MAKCCDPKNAASSFNRQVDFETPAGVANDSGGSDTTWTTTFSNVWVSIEPKVVREMNFAQRIEPRIVHIIRCRYFDGLNPKMRIKYGVRYFEIKAIIDESEGHEYLKIEAEERSGT